MNKILVVRNLLAQSLNNYISSLADGGSFEASKVGSRVDPVQKIREDFFLSKEDCAPLDTALMQGIAPIVKSEFDIELCYRERWKVGFYDGDTKGHYNPHTDIQGKMDHRQLSMVIAMSDPGDYEGGELVFPELDQSFKPEKGTALIFPSRMIHGVNAVSAGQRYTLLSFMFDAKSGLDSGRDMSNYEPLLSSGSVPSITAWAAVKHYAAAFDERELDYAAGEEVEGPLPEHLEPSHPESDSTPSPSAELEAASLQSENGTMEKVQLLLPLTPDSGPGNQLMGIKEALMMGEMLNRMVLLPPIHQHYVSGSRHWDFEEIYRYDLPQKARPFETADHAKLSGHSYVLHGNYLKKRLRIEDILDLSANEQLLTQRRFRNQSEYEELKAIDDEVLCIKHIFNNTTVSMCGWNGCNECATNPKLEPLYGDVCKHLDFSQQIKDFGDQFIREKLRDDFLAVHLRYPDLMQGKSFRDIAAYDETDIKRAIVEVSNRYGIDERNVFIATNKQDLLLNSILRDYRIYDGSHSDDIEPFVEQYICCRSKVFLMSKFNDYARMAEPHQRSTWSVAVADYRKHRLGNDSNLVLQDLF